MKKIRIRVLILSLVALLGMPLETEATTLREYQNLLQNYKNELAKNQAEVSKTESMIKQNQNEINSIKKQMTDMEKEVEQMKIDIVKYNEEIKKKSLETKQLFEYLQISNGENAYLEYAFGADTTTDFIYRMAIVEQMTEYNEKTIKNLEEMIAKNQQREKELAQKEKDMESRQKALYAKVDELTGMKNSLTENTVSVKQEVKSYQDQVNSYIERGCKLDDEIGVDCAVISPSDGTFIRPIQRGYVTSEFGYRWGSLHRAVDVSNNDPYNTKIYPVANGIISQKYYDSYGALTLVIEHKLPNGQVYSSLYTHMSKYAPGIEVGQKVSTNNYIGYMGDTGYALGPHLHLEIAPCRILNLADKNCGRWSNYVNYMKKIYDKGTFKGPRSLITFPKLGVWFYNR